MKVNLTVECREVEENSWIWFILVEEKIIAVSPQDYKTEDEAHKAAKAVLDLFATMFGGVAEHISDDQNQTVQ